METPNRGLEDRHVHGVIVLGPRRPGISRPGLSPDQIADIAVLQQPGEIRLRSAAPPLCQDSTRHGRR